MNRDLTGITRIFAFGLNLLLLALPQTGAGQATPAGAHVFEPGVVSTGHEFTLTFSPDGKTAYFTRNFPGEKRNHVMRTDLADGRWQEPVPVSFSSDAWSDLDPSVNPDGSRLYFVSTRPADGVPDSAAQNMDIWYADRDGDGWGEPVNLAVVNSPAKEGSPTAASDGTLCFFSDRDAEPNANAIYCSSEGDDGSFQEPSRLGPNVNSGTSDTSPFLSSDGRTMLFYSMREGGYGEADLYVSFREDGRWSPARNLGPSVNTSDWEYNPTVSRDGRTLYFGQARNIKAIALEALGVDGLTSSRFAGE